MDGIHDLGGRQGFGSIEREVDEPAFHSHWEASVFTMVNMALVSGIIGNVDQFRHSIERIDPNAYLDDGYYGRWLGGLETLLVEAGVLSSPEIGQHAEQRGATAQDRVAARPLPDPDTIDYAPESTTAQRRLTPGPKFAEGDEVRARAYGVPGHTRLPGYARGRRGRIVASRGGWVFPDSNAHGAGESPQHLYTVAFAGAELWGAAAEAGVTVHLDLFESYLESYLESGHE